MATIADVARRAGVSIATVSRVLSPGAVPHPVSADTARRVREAARELDFVPSALARGLASSHSGLIGLVVRDLADPHYPQIARGVEDLARERGFAVLVCNTLADSQRLDEYLRLLRARRVDAVVLSGAGSLTPRDLQSVRRAGVPAVLIGRPVEQGFPFVAVDNVGAAEMATQHLLDAGWQRIAHLGGPSAQTTMADRAAGYEAALDRAGLRPDIHLTDGSSEDGYRVAMELIGSPRRPDAIFAATDRLAVAALAAAVDQGLIVPRDLALVGFDDLPLVDMLRPGLTSMAQPGRQLGETAVRLVDDLLAERETQPVVLPAELIVRASSSR